MSEENVQQAESMADYTEELDASFRKIQEGDIMTGTVLSIGDEEAVIDLKSYAEGIIRKEDFSADPSFVISENVKPGDSITATVISTDDGKGNILLSQKEANEVLAWEKLQDMMDNETNIPVKVKGVVNGGVIAYVEGVRGFIPASKLSLSYVENLEEFLLKDLEVRVITVDPDRKKLVLSARDILREKADEERRQKVSNVEVGLVTEGVVENIQSYGAFVKLSDGLSGMVHVSQICQKRIKTPAAVLKVGDKVTVKIVGVKDGKISLSMKALSDASAEAVEEIDYDLPKTEELSTNLGSLLKNIKL